MTTGLMKKDFIRMYRNRLKEVQDGCSELPQVELPLLHDFAPGLYMRRIFMKKGTFVIGKTHKTEHFNIILSGAANVMVDGEIKLICAPHVFTSPPGAKKVLYILEDMIWATTHPTKETDLKKLEKQFIFSDKEELELINAEVKELV